MNMLQDLQNKSFTEMGEYISRLEKNINNIHKDLSVTLGNPFNTYVYSSIYLKKYNIVKLDSFKQFGVIRTSIKSNNELFHNLNKNSLSIIESESYNAIHTILLPLLKMSTSYLNLVHTDFKVKNSTKIHELF